jgi:formylglycine-generating enzyme
MDKLYMVIDLSEGSSARHYPVTYFEATPEGGWTNEYRGSKLVVRRIEPGTFIMGSPKSELGRSPKETQREVTITKPFYIGVFEVTQRQWYHVMGTSPSHFRGDYRPVEGVTYPMIRGVLLGTHFTADNKVDEDSFIGVLREKTGMMCDLPTEAQWEYACRAGTTTALNTGKDLTSKGNCINMVEAGRYVHNQSAEVGGYKQHTTVGSYLPNAWDLYDMHGNVWEWCRDWGSPTLGRETAIDPVGAVEGTRRVVRGGSWSYGANGCRSAFRSDSDVNGVHRTLGFRIVA